MSPGSFIFQEILRRLVLRLVLMMGEMGARRAGLVGRLAGMREGHRHRARLERELAKAERYAALVAEPAFWEGPEMAGMAAEVARVAGDAGRRALVRRVVWPGRLRRLRAFGLGVVTCDWGGRCTGGLGGLCVPPALPPQPLPRTREGRANRSGKPPSFRHAD